MPLLPRISLFAVVGLLSAVLLSTGCEQTSGAEQTPAVQHGYDTELLMFKDPYCGCCGDWADHVADEGISISSRDSSEMSRIKKEFGIAGQYQSCHTAVWHEHPYVFEGHVPARFIKQFLADPPEGAIGLAVPGMPLGSPGMEIDDRFDPYDVVLLKADGSATVYARIDEPGQQH